MFQSTSQISDLSGNVNNKHSSSQHGNFDYGSEKLYIKDSSLAQNLKLVFKFKAFRNMLPYLLHNSHNWTTCIRPQCRITTVLSCHRCLIDTSFEKWTTFKYRLELWPPCVSKEKMLVFRQLFTFFKACCAIADVKSFSAQEPVVVRSMCLKWMSAPHVLA
jgi:hypothetical protein